MTNDSSTEEEDQKMTKEEMEQTKNKDGTMVLALSMEMDNNTEHTKVWQAVKRTKSSNSPDKGTTLAAKGTQNDNYYRGLIEGLEKGDGESKEEVPKPYAIDEVLEPITRAADPISAPAPAYMNSYDRFLVTKMTNIRQTLQTE